MTSRLKCLKCGKGRVIRIWARPQPGNPLRWLVRIYHEPSSLDVCEVSSISTTALVRYARMWKGAGRG